jgi:hypothetical protein
LRKAKLKSTTPNKLSSVKRFKAGKPEKASHAQSRKGRGLIKAPDPKAHNKDTKKGRN